MHALTWVLLIIMFLLFCAGMILPALDKKKTKGNRQEKNGNMEYIAENESLKIASYKLTVPLRIQACERLMLYLERIKFPILVKRVFQPGISRGDFQFALIQNVQDEFEHNLAQRLYVTEDSWQLVNLAREEVLQNVNAVFADNPDADASSVAVIMTEFQNPIAEKAIINIKTEFDSFLI